MKSKPLNIVRPVPSFAELLGQAANLSSLLLDFARSAHTAAIDAPEPFAEYAIAALLPQIAALTSQLERLRNAADPTR